MTKNKPSTLYSKKKNVNINNALENITRDNYSLGQRGGAKNQKKKYNKNEDDSDINEEDDEDDLGSLSGGSEKDEDNVDEDDSDDNDDNDDVNDEQSLDDEDDRQVVGKDEDDDDASKHSENEEDDNASKKSDDDEKIDAVGDEETVKKNCYSKYATLDSDDLDYDELFADDDLKLTKTTRLSKPILFKYEKVRLLSTRARQLAQGAKPMIKNTTGLSSKEIALLELKNKLIPLIIERPIPNSCVERWRLSELEIPE